MYPSYSSLMIPELLITVFSLEVIILSTTRNIVLIKAIGLQFFQQLCLPFLNTGTMFTLFILFGSLSSSNTYLEKS